METASSMTNRTSFAAVILALLALASMPLVLLGLGLLEELMWGTGYVADTCRFLRIFEPLKAMLDALLGV
jgi:hypothetical protein